MRDKLTTLRSQMQQRIIGQERLIDRLLIGLLSGGHLLLEGMPGLAKTTAVNTLAEATRLAFKRIQFTPDMIPGDITGTDIFLPREGRFEFAPGPLFHEIILADEINRAPPKVQSALLEAMQEQQITVGGETRPLTDIFMVIATQNPIDQEGTYPLPEAQMDRFLMKVNIDYPSAEDELLILQADAKRPTGSNPEGSDAETPGSTETLGADPAVIRTEDILALRTHISNIYLDSMLERYIVTLVTATRNPDPWDHELSQWLSWGASPRATLSLARTARVQAWLRGRDFVEPDDIIGLAPDIMGHRIGIRFGAHAAKLSPSTIIERIIDHVPVP